MCSVRLFQFWIGDQLVVHLAIRFVLSHVAPCFCWSAMSELSLYLCNAHMWECLLLLQDSRTAYGVAVVLLYQPQVFLHGCMFSGSKGQAQVVSQISIASILIADHVGYVSVSHCM